MSMIDNLLRLVGLQRAPREAPVATTTITTQGSTGTPVGQTVEGQLFKQLSTGYCPDCRQEGFYAGPSGGLSQNIHCTNRACRSAFNITPCVRIAERIGKRDLSWYPPDPLGNRALPPADEPTEALRPGHRREPHDGY